MNLSSKRITPATLRYSYGPKQLGTITQKEESRPSQPLMLSMAVSPTWSVQVQDGLTMWSSTVWESRPIERDAERRAELALSVLSEDWPEDVGAAENTEDDLPSCLCDCWPVRGCDPFRFGSSGGQSSARSTNGTSNKHRASPGRPSAPLP